MNAAPGDAGGVRRAGCGEWVDPTQPHQMVSTQIEVMDRAGVATEIWDAEVIECRHLSCTTQYPAGMEDQR